MPKNHSSESVPTNLEIQDPIVVIVEAMRTVKADPLEIDLNSFSISDGNGGRVIL